MNNVHRQIIFFFLRFLKYYQYFHQKIIPLIKEKNEPKVFCIGDVKTGTSSMYKALNILGYRTVRLFDLQIWHKKGLNEYVKKIQKSKYDAYVDYPFGIGDLFKKIYKKFPNGKFIFTIRKKKSFQNSFVNYVGLSLEDNPKEIKERLEKYEDHNRSVITFFKDKPSQLLVMNVIEGDGWEKLCKFLDKPIPKKPFPHKNKGKYKNAK